jgi:AcrR family transcriptional regulator
VPKISETQRAAARRRLIDATIAVADRDGIDGLTTRAITAEAGVSPGMFYGHFHSKESLLAAVVDHKVEELTTLIATEVDLGAPLADVVRSFLHELIVVTDLRALSTFRAASGTEEARAAQEDINRRIVDAFAPIVEMVIDAGLVRPDLDAAAVVEVIDLLVDGVNRRRTTGGFVTSDERVCAVVIAAIENFMLATEGAPR